MMKSSIDVVDVFSSVPGKGNPVAVVYGCFSRPVEWQQSFARWVGLPETVFVDGDETPGAIFTVRIFSPLMELPFAGHPAIGAVRSFLSRGLVNPCTGEIVLRCKAGDVAMEVEQGVSGETISFTTLKPATVDPISNVSGEIARAVGGGAQPLSVSVADTGARWLVAIYASAGDLASMKPDIARIESISRRFDVSGISVVAPSNLADAAFEVRSFAPLIGVNEDAVCGGGNACVAAAISASREFAPYSARYVAAQGAYLKRDGRIFSDGPLPSRRYKIGGQAAVVISGDLHAPLHLPGDGG